jgi:hypothetical protein
MKLFPIVLTASLVLPLAACSAKKEVGVYDLPIAEVYDRLSRADINGFRIARQCGILIHFSSQKKKDESILWRVTSSGQEVLRFTVRLTAVGPNKTRTVIEIPKAKDGGEIYDGTKFHARPAIYQPLRPAVQELINAAIERRDYDVWQIPQPINMNDGVCSVQRGGLESGHGFKVDDLPGHDSSESDSLREQEESGGSNPGEPALKLRED